MQGVAHNVSLHVKNVNKLTQRKPPRYWENKQNVTKFLEEIKQKYDLQRAEDWDLISRKQIQSLGGGRLFTKYTLYELKCMACPEGKSIFDKSKENEKNKENTLQFLEEIKQKYNLHTPEDWNLLSNKHIQSNGGHLLGKYSLYELKCLGCPEGKSVFDKPNQSKPAGYWNKKENVHQFLEEIKEKYNLQTPDDWKLLSQKQIKVHGGSRLFNIYSLYELKCMGCPEGKSVFDKPNQYKSAGYWDNDENIKNFLEEIKGKYNLQTPEDWNTITTKKIQFLGGKSLFSKYSIYELKCMGCPEGKSMFDNQYKPAGYWDNKQNILQFLEEMKEKYNLQTPDDWNSLSFKQIQSNGGISLLTNYSMYELKCLGCPEGKLIFDKPIQYKPAKFWDNDENIKKFLEEIKQKYNLQTPDDWNTITTKHIKSNGASVLFAKYSLFDLKCLACPDYKLLFERPNQSKSTEFWNDETNRNDFFEQLKVKFNLKTPEDWKRLSSSQIISQGGRWLFYNNNEHIENSRIKFEVTGNDNTTTIVSYRLKDLIVESNHKRSSQRWLFLQIQKLFPHDEIVEDYFHSEISRETGFSVQFDIFLIERNVAIEYHGRHHYEDIPTAFAPLEMHQNRDEEKKILCAKYGIQLIVIPYWWNNKLESLRETLNSIVQL